jgi:D-sedoheptulose 7-phosphate isomerase
MSYNISKLFELFPALLCAEKSINQAFELIKNTFINDGAMFVCGNGGSAADAEHMVGELMKSFLIPRPVDQTFKDTMVDLYGEQGNTITSSLQEGMRAISLNGHPSLTTAFGNDVDYSMVFAQQLYVMGRANDLLVGFTTSGNSENVISTLKVAKAKKIKTIVFTGAEGGESAKFADCCIKVPETETYRVQEYHLPVYHALCAMLEEHFYGKKTDAPARSILKV